MSNFGEIKWEVWETKAAYNEKHPSHGADSFDFFLSFCKKKLPQTDLIQSCELFSQEKIHLNEKVKKSIEILANEPFLTAFLVWIKEVAIDPPRRLAAKMLLEHGFIGITDHHGRIWTIANAQKFDHRNVVEAIRCHQEWHFHLRENLILTYLDFMQWFSTTTFGYIEKVEDPDLARSQGRFLAYTNFINFLNKLKDEDRLVAKLLYFGGSRTLEEVLAILIEHVDFTKKFIYFELLPVSFPLHVFSDIESILQGRRSGRLFIGRRGNALALNPATIFRNFKEAGMEVGLGKDFTPRVLTTNII